MELIFYGAARTVTGSKHLLKLDSGKQVLLDCGMFQGMGSEADLLNRSFGFDPRQIDYVLLSHAHIDHSGLIPRLVREGFAGTIYCTPATYDLCELMLHDSGSIQESDIEFINKRRKRKGLSLLKPLYSMEDAAAAFPYFKTIDYNHWEKPSPDFSFCFTDAGHVLGSSCINVRVNEGGIDKKLLYTADIGRPIDQILKSPQPFPQPDYIICESTYGDRVHEPILNSEERLLRVVRYTCEVKKGKLIIPAFSLDRTQEIIYALDRMSTEGKLPPVKVYLDSPLSVKTTQVVESHKECFNDRVQEYMLLGDRNPFFFRNLIFITDPEESKKLNKSKEPCIIISASGMAEAGRIKHHIKNNIEDPSNTILMVGYCTPSSLGGRLMAGDKVVRIFGDEYQVRAQIEIIESYSAHADHNEIISFLKFCDLKKVKTLFLVHGELSSMQHIKADLEKEGCANVQMPEKQQSWFL